MGDVTLPDWASFHEDKTNHIIIDPAKAYPALLEEMGVDDPTVFDVECAFKCAILDLQVAMKTKTFSYTVLNPGPGTWALKSFEPREGSTHDEDIEAATKGGGAREAYKRMRGFFPG